MNAVTGVGAPSYTSGVHIWNGTAESLNASPAITNATPTIRPVETLAGIGHRLRQLGEIHRAGESVDQRNAVQQQAGCQRAEHEIFQPGLGGPQSSRANAAST